jgi:hypothetical protein
METKATVYFPTNSDILEINWQQQEYKEFTDPFANGLYYKMLINENNTTKSIEIKFQI